MIGNITRYVILVAVNRRRNGIYSPEELMFNKGESFLFRSCIIGCYFKYKYKMRFFSLKKR